MTVVCGANDPGPAAGRGASRRTQNDGSTQTDDSEKDEVAELSGFSCQTRREGNLVVLAVGGDVDLAAADGLWDGLREALQPGVRVVADLANVTFLDSTGLRVLVRAEQTSADLDGAEFELAAPSAPVLRVLELSGTEAMFSILESAPAVGE